MLLAVSLILLVVVTTSVLAFLLYVGSLNETIANEAHQIDQRALEYERLREPLSSYAPVLAAEISGQRVGVRVYDDRRRLLAQSSRADASAGKLTRGAAAVLGLRPAIVRVDGGTIVVAPILEGFARLLARYLSVVAPIGALAVIAAWLMGRALARRAVAPLQDVAAALRRIAGGNLAPEPLLADTGSLHELTSAYNEVALRLTAATVERERNELQMRQFIADAGHELRTPLTIVMGYLEILQQGVVGDPTSVGHVYETMLAESRRMRAAIEKLILLARLERPAAPHTELLDAAALAGRVATALQPLAGTGRIALTTPTLPCSIAADESELYEAIQNVVENAVRYAPQSPITMDIACDDSEVKVVVGDQGPGMEPHDVEHAFDRFYRGGARSGEGSGLGLAIAKRAIERAGGSIVIESRPAQGTRVTIALPRGS